MMECGAQQMRSSGGGPSDARSSPVAAPQAKLWPPAHNGVDTSTQLGWRQAPEERSGLPFGAPDDPAVVALREKLAAHNGIKARCACALMIDTILPAVSVFDFFPTLYCSHEHSPLLCFCLPSTASAFC